MSLGKVNSQKATGMDSDDNHSREVFGVQLEDNVIQKIAQIEDM